MERIIVFCFDIFERILFFSKKEKFGIRYSAILLSITIMLAVLCIYIDLMFLTKLFIFLLIAEIGILLMIFQFDTEDFYIKLFGIKKIRLKNLRERFSELSFKRYIIGIFFLVPQNVLYMLYILFSFCKSVDVFLFLKYIYLFFSLLFTFLYYSYHIYIKKHRDLKIIQRKVTFNMALWTSISFLFSMIGIDKGFILYCLSGGLMIFEWLLYIIYREETKIEDQD